MKRKLSEDKAPASPPKEGAKGREMGNQHAQGEWWDPVTSDAGGLKDQASAGPTPPELMSEEKLEALSPTPGEAGPGLTHPIPLPPGVLNQTAMQLKAFERYKGLIEDLFPRAYQQLCKEQRFLGGTEPSELAFIDTHGRRWRAGEGFLLSAEGLEKAPAVPELKFDPANLEASCKMLRDLFEGISFPARPATLEKYVRECHKAIHRERERRKTALRDQGEPGAYGIARQSYKAFARDGLVFVGDQVRFLATYIDLCSKGSGAQKAEQLVLKRRKKALEKKSLAEERKSST